MLEKKEKHRQGGAESIGSLLCRGSLLKSGGQVAREGCGDAITNVIQPPFL